MDATALYRLASRGLPLLPFPLNVRIQRFGRAAVPGRRLRAAHQVAPGTAGGVPVVWLDRHLAGQGVLVYLHGGSYVTGPVPGQWRWLSALARRARAAAVMIDYRLAPEHPHPAALGDVAAALESLQSAEVLQEGGWALMGDSAGAALALTAARTLAVTGGLSPAALVLCAPWTDLTLSNPRIPVTEPEDPVLSRAFLGPSAAAYAGSTPLDDPAISPLNGDLAGLPPVHLSTGTRDVLVHDARLLRERLRRAGVAVNYLEEPDALHAYPTLVAGPAFDRAVTAHGAFLRRHLSTCSSRNTDC